MPTAVSNDIFDKKYKELNPLQKEAVDSIDGPVMVIAGPGTGKTTILTLRIANILKRTDTPAHGILAITYTDAGVKAMRSKLHEVIGSRAHDVHIHTFHSFATAMISEYPDHFVHLDGVTTMTDVEQEILIRSIVTESKFSELRPVGKPDVYVSAIIRSIEDYKRDEFTPAAVRKYIVKEIQRIKNDESSLSTRGPTKGKLKAEARKAIEKCERTLLFADVYEEYESRKTAAGQLDFNDLIIQLLVALHKDELLLRLIQERFLYLLIDEHQDTNDSQNSIIGLIAEFFETPNIFIVGDEKQAIYRFQGASVENFLRLQKRWKDMKRISLDTNYRSHQSILDAAFGMIEQNYENDDEHKELRVRLNSRSKEKSKPIDVVTGENTSAIEKYLVDQLTSIAKKEPHATAAIITRRNRDLDRIIRLLESNSIPVVSERSVDIFNHPVGALFFDLVEYIADPTRNDSLAKTIIAGMWGLSFTDATELVRTLSSGKDAQLENKLPALTKIRTNLLSDNSVGFLIHAADLSGFLKLIESDVSHVHVWRGIIALAESLARNDETHDPMELMKKMLAYKLSSESKTVKITVGAPDVPFKAMTAHGSKGLEFDYVFIPYATEEAWVGRNRGSSFVLPKKQASNNDITDTRRLFYVAITRARKHVTILSALEESDGKALTPLRFISELDQKHVKETVLSRASFELPKANELSAHPKQKSAYVDLAKRTLVEKGLSVTALNHYMNCPSEFLYQSILRIPQAPSVPAEKGNAMHHALAKVWSMEASHRSPHLKKGATREASGGFMKIEKRLIEGITEFLDDSFLPLIEKMAVKKELLENAPIVAKALESHFKQEGKVLTESWVQTIFEGTYDNTSLHIPIHGKLDAIIDSGREVNVFDYKTRQAMSVAALKGETKNSDGNYFRQLVFYYILLRNDPRWKLKKVVPSLVFVSPDDKGRCPTVTLPINENDVEKVKKEIQELIDDVWNGTFVDKTCGDPRCEWCGMRGIM